MAYWYNLNTHQVETEENRARAEHLLGPYETEEQARNAVASAKARTEQWDKEDDQWDNPPA